MFNLNISSRTMKSFKINLFLRDLFMSFFPIILGHFLIAFGIYVLLQLGHGMDSWTVLSEGISITLGISLGVSNAIVGLVTLIISILLKEIPGISTIWSVFLVGVYLTFMLNTDFLHFLTDASLLISLLLIVFANVSIAFGIALYISKGYGAGSRDAIFVWFVKVLPLPVAVSKVLLDFIVISIGVLLGGTFGYGTIITLIILGPLLDLSFKILKSDAKTIKQRTLIDYFQ